ncbi:phosphate signaling complex protein PhoU [Halorubellus sp. PRR65]|uniref:phosphate signaling complex protein PhoU n=1 Tax=Halorubellus sp. PRR65 TaxID=3098148 RepID=UPI002B2606A5|nr:phosphate signaling complex protein PhoU [Halorubellus sp. PRR65]
MTSVDDRVHDLHASVRTMSEVAREQLDLALAAYRSADAGLARTVVDGDAVLDSLHREVERDCINLIARHHPVATDLRFVVATFKVATDLERVGDLAVKIARRATAEDWAPTLGDDLQDVADLAADIVEDAVHAYLDRDADTARAVAARDDDLDAACEARTEALFRELVGSGGPSMTDVTSYLLTVRDLERVGDHGENVAARTVYAVENDPALLY